jgi:D-alanine-D-alanine ligase
MRLDVIMGGPGGEAAVSRQSGSAVAAAAKAIDIDTMIVDIEQRLDPARLRSEAVVFNLVHGHYGEDGTLQAELDAAGFSYVGSDAACSRLCIDKQATKERLRQADLPVVWGCVIDPSRPVGPRSLGLPDLCGYVLKPKSDGSSVGVRMLANPGQLLPAVEDVLHELGPMPMLLEQRLTGDEYTVGLIEEHAGWRVLPPIRVAAADGFYDYAAKYERNDTGYDFDIEVALADKLSTLGLRAATACGCRDLVRVDIMADADGSLSILELNTLPGFTDHSLVPKAAARVGWSMSELVRHLVQRAAKRRGVHA